MHELRADVAFTHRRIQLRSSCSTCVGVVQGTGSLGTRSEDEEDIIDMLGVDEEEASALRATCCVQLRPTSYTFRHYDGDFSLDSNEMIM